MKNYLKKLIKKIIRLSGYDIQKYHNYTLSAQSNNNVILDTFGLSKVQYACGPKFLKKWVNVDCYPPEIMQKRYEITNEYIYYQADLSQRQPFKNNSFSFAFAEDFIEHLNQADSLIFLSETLRVLKHGGVLRLSSPGFEGVLKQHFSSSEYNELLQGKKDAYQQFEHLHFYSKDTLERVAKHLGFTQIQFLNFGHSLHEELNGMETRAKQQHLNIYAELTK